MAHPSPEKNKKAELSQRWPRDERYVWVPLKYSWSPWLFPRLLFQKFVMGFCSDWARAKFEYRSFSRSWDNRGYTKKLGSPWIRPRSLFAKIFNGNFVQMDPLNIRANFEIRSFSRSWDNRGYPKKLGQSLDTPTLPFLQNFSWAFIRMDPLIVLAKFEMCSFSRAWDRPNRGYPKKMGSPWIRPRSLFCKNFNGLLFGRTFWMYWPNLKCVAFPVPELMGGIQKIGAVPGYAHASFSPKLFMGFWSDRHCYCCGQIWSS